MDGKQKPKEKEKTVAAPNYQKWTKCCNTARKLKCHKRAKPKRKCPANALMPGIQWPLQDEENHFFIPVTNFCTSQSTQNLNGFIDELLKQTFVAEPQYHRYPPLTCLTNSLIRRNVADMVGFCTDLVGKRIIQAPQLSPDTYCKRAAVESYMKTKASNIVLLGKPDPDHRLLGDLLAKQLNYQHISPTDVMNKAIYEGSFIGKWIYSHLSMGEKIPIDIVLKLIAFEVCNEKCQQTGFVLSGLPIISDQELIQNCFIHGPNVVGKTEQFVPNGSDHESELLKADLLDDDFRTSRDSIDNVYEESDSDGNLDEQLSAIDLSGSKNPPEMVTVHEWFESYLSDAEYDVESLEQSVEKQIDFLDKLNMSIAIYLHNTDSDLLSKRSKQDTLTNTVTQITNTHKVLPLIEQYFAQFGKSQGFQIDMRFSRAEIVEAILRRLDLIKMKRIYVPELVFDNCRIPESFRRRFDSNDFETNYDTLLRTDCIQPRMFWHKSEFQYHCPVEMFYGKLRRGKLNLGLRYMGDLMLFSSRKWLEEFISCPAKFMFTKPTCRMAIVGPNKCGKSLLAHQMHAMLKAPIFDCKTEFWKIRDARAVLDSNTLDGVYRDAVEYAHAETTHIYKESFEHYQKLKSNFMFEIRENVISIIYELIDGGRQSDSYSFDHLVKEYLPEECFEEIQMPGFSDPLYMVLLQEAIYDLTLQRTPYELSLLEQFLSFEAEAHHDRVTQLNDQNFHSQWIIDDAPTSVEFWQHYSAKIDLPDVFIIFETITESKCLELYEHFAKPFENMELALENFLATDHHWLDMQSVMEEFGEYTPPRMLRFQHELDKYVKYLAARKQTEMQVYQEKINRLKSFLKSKNVRIIEVDCSQGRCQSQLFELIFFRYFTIFLGTPKPIDFGSDVTSQFQMFNTKSISAQQESRHNVQAKQSEIAQGKRSEYCMEGRPTARINEKVIKHIRIDGLELGATRNYCPVTLVDKNILMAGSIKYCVEYCNKYHLFRSLESMEKFVQQPQKYFFEHRLPEVPAARICLLGPNSKAKTFFATQLAAILKVPVYFNKDDWKSDLDSFSSVSIEESRAFRSTESIQQVINKIEDSNGFILCGYTADRSLPLDSVEQIPEAVFVFDEEAYLSRQMQKRYLKESLHTDFERSRSKLGLSMMSVASSIANDEKRKVLRGKIKVLIETIMQSIEDDTKYFRGHDCNVITIPSSFVDPLIVEKTIGKYANAVNNDMDRETLFAVPKLIDLDTALKCLDTGYFKQSKFGLSCPAHRVPVPDERFDFLCEYHKPLSKVPAYLNVVDIAGLVKGASEGQGLGNAFLSHISACDAIFHLCRAFEDSDVTHVEGEVDPVRDLDIISEELRLKDEEKIHQVMEKLEKTYVRGGDKKLKPEYDSMLKIKHLVIEEKKQLRFADWTAHDIEALNKNLFLTSKPVIYLVNLSDKDFIRKKNKWLIKIKEWVDKNDPGATIIPFSGAFESKLMEMDDAERKAYEEEQKCKSNLDKIIVQGYKALQLEYFFTAGHDEVKAWTIQKGTKAPQAAGRIHTDFEKGFIMAEVMHYKDFKEEGSEASCKSAGKYRQQGRNYQVEDGDIIFFKFNAGAGLKDPKKK